MTPRFANLIHASMRDRASLVCILVPVQYLLTFSERGTWIADHNLPRQKCRDEVAEHLEELPRRLHEELQDLL